jgi:hypothetical protein
MPLDSRPKTAHAIGRGTSHTDSSSAGGAGGAATTSTVAWAPDTTAASSTITFQQAATEVSQQAAQQAAALKQMRAQTSVDSLCRALDRTTGLRHIPKSYSRGSPLKGKAINLGSSCPPSSPSSTLMNLTRRPNNHEGGEEEQANDEDPLKLLAARMLAPRTIPQRRRQRTKTSP